MARILLLAGGCRARELSCTLSGEGHAVRATTRSEAGRAAIEASGAECWIGTPERLATLRGALDGVTIACWLLATATAPPSELAELHTHRLEYFLMQVIDTTVRGFVYEAGASTPALAEAGAGSPARGALAAGEQILARICEQNAIPSAVLRADPAEPGQWSQQARRAIEALLERR